LDEVTDTITLRDGSDTEDVRLDRLIQFDERSRNFSIGPVVEDRPLKGKTWYQQTWLDQGREGACVGFSWAHSLAGSPITVKGLDFEFARTSLYWEAQKIDPWPGGSFPGATPYYEGTSVLSGAKIAQRLGYIESYRWAFTIDDLLKALSHEGDAVLGIPWFDTMFSTRPSGLLDCSGREIGGHAIQARGLSLKPTLKGEKLKEPVVRLHNSWGKGWGINGDAFVKVSDLEALLRNYGEACIPQGRKIP
jgi:hypothetical protein